MVYSGKSACSLVVSLVVFPVQCGKKWSYSRSSVHVYRSVYLALCDLYVDSNTCVPKEIHYSYTKTKVLGND